MELCRSMVFTPPSVPPLSGDRNLRGFIGWTFSMVGLTHLPCIMPPPRGSSSRRSALCVSIEDATFAPPCGGSFLQGKSGSLFVEMMRSLLINQFIKTRFQAHKGAENSLFARNHTSSLVPRSAQFSLSSSLSLSLVLQLLKGDNYKDFFTKFGTYHIFL